MSSARELLQWAERELSAIASLNAEFDALFLLSEAVGVSRTQILLKEEISGAQEKVFREWIERRTKSEPIQYITGRAYFRNLTLEVGPGVLIPRPESEELVSAVKAVLGNQSHVQVLDLGSGSGALAISIASEVPGAYVTALEKDTQAIYWLNRNIHLAGVDISLVKSDVSDFDGQSQFDVVIANPPYIPDGQSLPTEVMNFEPHIALFGGKDGMNLPQEFIDAAARALKPGGFLALEHNETQGEVVAQFMASYFDKVTLHYDLNQRPRWTSGVRK